jgi:4-oxalocrotonate tautomerase
MLAGVQDAVAAIEGEPMRAGIGVVLEEASATPDLALNCLPFVSVTLIRDALSTTQRAAMAASIAEAIIAIEGEARRGQIWVVIEENVVSGEWSIGGNALTLDALTALKQGRNPWA